MLNKKEKKILINLSAFLAGDNSLKMVKSLLVRNVISRTSNVNSVKSWLYKARYVLTVLTGFVFLFLKKDREKGSSFYLDSIDHTTAHHNHVTSYLEGYDLFDMKPLLLKDAIVFTFPTIEEVKIVVKFLLITPIVMFYSGRVTNILYHCLISYFKGLTIPRGSKLAIFRYYKESGYLSSLLLAKIKNIETILLVGGDPAIYSRRYTYNPDAVMLLQSKYHISEFNLYSARNWFLCKDVRLKKENIDENSGNYTFDVALYSSGFWGRHDCGSRMMPSLVQSGVKNLKNQDYINFVSLLLMTREVCKKNSLKMKVYFHPLEFELLNLGVPLPYSELLDGIELDEGYCSTTGFDANKRFREAKVGISSLSTVAFDRWTLNLSSVVYLFGNSDVESVWVNKKYTGEYADFFVENLDELEKVILSEMTN